MAEATKEQLLEQLEERRKHAMAEGHIDNSSLWAGSPMHYYCVFCGAKTDELPESHRQPARRVCDACEILQGLGWHDEVAPKFPFKGSLADRVPSLTD
jgi:hypothetical protein